MDEGDADSRRTFPDEMTGDVRIDMFPFLLQAVYNVYKLYELMDEGEDWRLDGDHEEAVFLETRFLVKFFHKLGADPMYPVRADKDGNLVMRHLSMDMLRQVREEYRPEERLVSAEMQALRNENAALRAKLKAQASTVRRLNEEAMAARKKAGDIIMDVDSSIKSVAAGINSAAAAVSLCVAALRSMSPDDPKDVARSKAAKAVGQLSKAAEAMSSIQGDADRIDSVLQKGRKYVMLVEPEGKAEETGDNHKEGETLE